MQAIDLLENSKQQGNDAFKSGDYHGALKHYTDAVTDSPFTEITPKVTCFRLSFSVASPDLDGPSQ